MTDFRGMVGDPSDNLPGRPGHRREGRLAAARRSTASLDEVLAHAGEQTPKRARGARRAHADDGPQTARAGGHRTDAPGGARPGRRPAARLRARADRAPCATSSSASSSAAWLRRLRRAGRRRRRPAAPAGGHTVAAVAVRGGARGPRHAPGGRRARRPSRCRTRAGRRSRPATRRSDRPAGRAAPAPALARALAGHAVAVPRRQVGGARDRRGACARCTTR